MRVRRTARIPTHPHEPKLEDVLAFMRKRDILELLKTKRRGELDQVSAALKFFCDLKNFFLLLNF